MGSTSHKELGAQKRVPGIWEGLVEVQRESRSMAVPPKALSWVWCTIRRRGPVGGIWSPPERARCARRLRNGAPILYWLRLDLPALSARCARTRLESGRQQLSCRPSPFLLLRCNFFNEENLLSGNITFLKACPDKAVQAGRVAYQLQQISVTHYRDSSPPHLPATPLVPRQGNESHSCS